MQPLLHLKPPPSLSFTKIGGTVCADEIRIKHLLSHTPSCASSKPGDPSSLQLYTGYLMSYDATLAGSFEAFQGSGATAERSTFGWFAKLPPVIA